jgi:DNA polymerase
MEVNMKMLSCDVETYSQVSLAKSGVYKYAESPDFEILLFGYSADGGKVEVVDLARGEALPEKIAAALLDDGVIKWAYNASFERICLSRHLGVRLKPDSWRCTMVWAATLGLPLSLEGAAIVTGADKKKLADGKELIRYFCVPCKPTAVNGGRTRNLPADAGDKWEQFIAYNKRDVETEMAIQKRLSNFPVPSSEWENYFLDQQINDRGIQLDMNLVAEAIRFDNRSKAVLTEKLKALTSIENPGSVLQMKCWLAENGLGTDSLDKKAVAELLKTAPPALAEVLKLREALAKSSVSKYKAMDAAVCTDGRARGLLQFYGANRTGRWAGRLIQVQNLPQNHMPDLTPARQLVRAGDYGAVEALYDSVPGGLSELIRTAFVPKPGFKFIVADFSAIEARVLSWLAGEVWRNEVFAGDGKIYEATAVRMFGVPVESVTKTSEYRQKAKQTELACGYGGSIGALKAMGALEMGLAEKELKPLVDAWRSANPSIVKLWREIERAAISAVRGRISTRSHGIEFTHRSGMLFITLP